MGGFANQYLNNNGNPQDIMNMYSPEQVPVFTALAQNFRVFTRWFSDLPGPTGPNRAPPCLCDLFACLRV